MYDYASFGGIAHGYVWYSRQISALLVVSCAL